MKTIAVDFDGVIHKYSDGWQDGAIYDEPIDGAIDAVRSLVSSGLKVVILTARPIEQHKLVAMWLKKYIPETIDWIKQEKLVVTNVKPPAICYIDDRAIAFTGDWVSTLSQVEGCR